MQSVPSSLTSVGSNTTIYLADLLKCECVSLTHAMCGCTSFAPLVVFVYVFLQSHVHAVNFKERFQEKPIISRSTSYREFTTNYV